jgi:hypothetical protein
LLSFVCLSFLGVSSNLCVLSIFLGGASNVYDWSTSCGGDWKILIYKAEAGWKIELRYTLKPCEFGRNEIVKVYG